MKLSQVKDAIMNKIHKLFSGFKILLIFWIKAENTKVITPSRQEKTR